MLLRVSDLHARYGKSHVLHGVTLEVDRGEIVCLVGRNGVGKSTTLKSIMGLVRPSAGEVVFTLADRVSVIYYGRVLATGTCDEIRANPEVKRAYLGRKSSAAAG